LLGELGLIAFALLATPRAGDIDALAGYAANQKHDEQQAQDRSLELLNETNTSLQ
jgi:hypothetical protein